MYAELVRGYNTNPVVSLIKGLSTIQGSERSVNSFLLVKVVVQHAFVVVQNLRNLKLL